MIASLVAIGAGMLVGIIFLVFLFDQIHKTIKEFIMATHPEIQSTLDAILAAAARYAALPVAPPPAELSPEDVAALAQAKAAADAIAPTPVAP